MFNNFFRLINNAVVRRHLTAPLIFLLLNALLHAATPFTPFTETTQNSLIAIFARTYIIGIIWLMIRIVHVVKLFAMRKFDMTVIDNLRARKVRTQLQFIERTVNITLVLIGVAVILTTFDSVRRFGSGLIASAGILGVVIGFAAQKMLGTFLAGLQVAFTQPIRLDDVVVVENEWGRIEEITLSYVVVRIWDKRRLIVPINYFTEKTFTNWTRTGSDLLSYVFLHFDFSLDIAAVRAEFLNVLKDTPLWDGSVAVVQVTNATETTMQVRFLMGAHNSGQSFELGCLVREKIIAYVQKHFPTALPQRRIYGAGSIPL